MTNRVRAVGLDIGQSLCSYMNDRPKSGESRRENGTTYHSADNSTKNKAAGRSSRHSWLGPRRDPASPDHFSLWLVSIQGKTFA